MFSAHEADPEGPDLGYKEKKDLEKQLKASQNGSGAAAAAATHLLTKIQDESDKLLQTAKDYRDAAVVVADPRQEAAQIMDMVRTTMMDDWAKVLADQVKIIAWQYNQLLMLRRYIFILFQF